MMRTCGIFILLLVYFVTPVHAAQSILSHTIDISVDINARRITGSDALRLADGTGPELRLFIRKRSKVDGVEFAGAPAPFTLSDTSVGNGVARQELRITLPPVEGASQNERTVTVYFSAAFDSIDHTWKRIKRGLAFIDDGMMGDEWAFLPAAAYWYPREIGTLARYDISISTPAGYETVMEGELAYRSVTRGKANGGAKRMLTRWTTRNALDGINLVIGKYTVEKERYKGVDIYTFFLTEDAKLSRTYIEKTKWYLDLYRDIFTPYPFKKFAIVENFLPTGYGMSSYTLLGSRVLRLPFIPDTSLGHEFAHNWWGNSAFMDRTYGNWAEGLTSYIADHLYAEIKGEDEAIRYRTRSLTAYMNYAGADGAALMDFIYAEDSASRVVGYNKGAMVFHMLRRLVGKEVFYKALRVLHTERAFAFTSWRDIEAVFEKVSQKKLGWFFAQWIIRSGGPSLSIPPDKVKVERTGERFLLSFVVEQHSAGEPYVLNVPVVIETEGGGRTEQEIEIKDRRQTVRIETDERPVSFELDPERDTFRILARNEMARTVGSLLGDRDALLVLPSGETKKRYVPVAEILAKDYGQKVVSDTEVDEKVLAKHSLFIFGGPSDNLAFESIKGGLPKGVTITKDSITVGKENYALDEMAAVVVMRNPLDPEKTVSVMLGNMGGGSMARVGRRIEHLTGKSFIVFDPHGGFHAEIFEGDKVLRHELK